MNETTATAAVECAECGHLHWVNGRGYVPCPLASEGCPCTMATEYPADDEDDERTCEWCGEPISDDDGTSFCGRRGVTLHTSCHYDSECRCRG